MVPFLFLLSDTIPTDVSIHLHWQHLDGRFCFREWEMELSLGLPLKGEHRVRLLIQEVSHDLWRRQGTLCQKLLGNSLSTIAVLYPWSEPLVHRGVCFWQVRLGHTLLMSTKIESRESVISNGEFFGCCSTNISAPIFKNRALRLFTGDCNILGCSVGCRMATRSFCTPPSQKPQLRLHKSQHFSCRHKWVHTFSMCRRVVFPALSRPKNSNFACLFSRPREARIS